ncbi:hypothetical protein [Picosynechococcus sp. NKBG15041c]|nr:hypothetical protein [Picosynechococcus sp. NKBG15041c]
MSLFTEQTKKHKIQLLRVVTALIVDKKARGQGDRIFGEAPEGAIAF